MGFRFRDHAVLAYFISLLNLCITAGKIFANMAQVEMYVALAYSYF